ncbi:MAG: low temperature requirement protein A [Brevibacterium sp.]
MPTPTGAAPSRFRLTPMRPRDPGESGRAASTLELFFDLVFVIAVSIASTNLHDTVTAGHLGEGLGHYFIVFFGIWWAWMNFTWFATSFDTDDWLYRVLTIVQMGGVLVLAAGIGPVFEHGDEHILVYGYVLMRIVMIAQWLRASRHAGSAKRTTIIYACGIGGVQLLWLLWLLVPSGALSIALMVLLVLAEVSIPVLAELREQTPWHPHHITERYGCFTIIVLGESLLASADAIFEAFSEIEDIVPLVSLGVLCLIVTAAMWWIYFWPPHHRAIGGVRGTLKYGYGHYFIFGAAGAFSAGVGVEVDSQLGHSALDPVLATFTVSVPIAIFVLGVWLLAIRPNADGLVNTVIPLCAVLVLLDPIIPIPTFLTTVFMIIIVITLVLRAPTGSREDTVTEVAEG